MDSIEDITVEVVYAVAEATGRDPMDLDPIGRSIDVDALHSLVYSSSIEALKTVQLQYEGCKVTVDRETVTAKRLPSH